MKRHLLIVLLLISFTALSQIENRSNRSYPMKQWFVSAAYGVQMSGIKDEDFISKNIAPAISVGVGVWFTPEIALQLSYKGYYFNTIADDDQHAYYFFLGEVLLNIHQMINSATTGRWNVIAHSGAGYFYNKYYKRPNVCGNIGVISDFQITEYLSAFADVSFIVGWDIYQGNDDILPSCLIGINVSF